MAVYFAMLTILLFVFMGTAMSKNDNETFADKLRKIEEQIENVQDELEEVKTNYSSALGKIRELEEKLKKEHVSTSLSQIVSPSSTTNGSMPTLTTIINGTSTPTIIDSTSTVNGSTSTVNGSTSTVNGSTSTVNGSASTVNGSTSPVNGSMSTVNGSTSPVNGSMATVAISPPSIEDKPVDNNNSNTIFGMVIAILALLVAGFLLYIAYQYRYQVCIILCKLILLFCFKNRSGVG